MKLKLLPATAVILAGTSGAIATYGLTKVIPGAPVIVIGLGILFEAAKLTSLTTIHRKQLPRTLKLGLGAVAGILMCANIAGVSGMLSSAYKQRQIETNATEHNATVVNNAAVEDLRRQLNAADLTIASANAALVKARDNRARAKAAELVVTHARSDRDALATRMTDATATLAKSEATAIRDTGEFAAVAFLASTFGVGADTAAQILITTLSAIPDIAAALLLWASSHKPVTIRQRRKKLKRRTPPKRPAPSLRVVA